MLIGRDDVLPKGYVRSPWAAKGGEGAWNLVPSQSKLCHVICVETIIDKWVNIHLQTLNHIIRHAITRLVIKMIPMWAWQGGKKLLTKNPQTCIQQKLQLHKLSRTQPLPTVFYNKNPLSSINTHSWGIIQHLSHWWFCDRDILINKVKYIINVSDWKLMVMSKDTDLKGLIKVGNI